MRKVFIDCGSYDGCSVRKFRDTRKDAHEFEIYCFEPNPCIGLTTLFPKATNITYLQKAVWIGFVVV